MLDRQFGKYELIRRLGRGGMADVYLARDAAHDRLVAIKLVELCQDRESRDIYDAERRGAVLQQQFSRLDTHVPQVHEFGTCDGHFYIDMEYVEGEDLAERIGRSRVSPDLAASIAADVCEFLAKAHSFETTIDGASIRGIIHGDIKPKNIRINRDGQVKVLDFGIAKGLSLTRKLTRNDFGSLGYLSPERLDTGEVDAQSDCWSVGVLLYEMLAGAPPFDHRDAQKLEQTIRARQAPPPLPDDCPAALVRIVLKLLAPSVVRRYPSAAAILTDLQAFRTGEPTEADRSWLSSANEAEATRRTRPHDEGDTAGVLAHPESVHAALAPPDTARSVAAAELPPPAAPPPLPGVVAELARPATAASADGTGTVATLEADTPPQVAATATASDKPEGINQPDATAAAVGAPPDVDSDATRRTSPVGAPDADATRRTSSASSTDVDATRRTGTVAVADADATRRTAPLTPGADSMPVAAPPAVVTPRRKLLDVRPGRVIAGIVLGLFIFVGGVIWNEWSVWAAARELRVTLATQQGGSFSDLWDQYQALSKRSLLGIGPAAVRGPLKERLVSQADQVIENYRQQDAPTVREGQWRRAEEALTDALRLDPGDRTVTASLRYCQGQLQRIAGEARLRRKEPAADTFHEAINRFQEAAQLNSRWPDPYLGLTRTYVYGLDDLDKAIEAMEQAKRRGYRPGNRELVQMADGYRRRAGKMQVQADSVRGLPQEMDCLQKSVDDYHKSLDLYGQAIGFGEAGNYLRLVQKQLDTVNARLEALKQEQAAKDAESGLKGLLRSILGRK